MTDDSHYLDYVFRKLGYELEDNIKFNIELTLKKSMYQNNHVSFILDTKFNKIESYAFNTFFSTNSWPYSIHAEVYAILKYYKNNTKRSNNKKILLTVKLSKTGVIGNSKPCINCVKYIRQHFDNLNLENIYFSNEYRTITSIKKDDLIENNFRLSKAALKKNNTKIYCE
jgi:cytidine deaminase